ncbi:MAG: archaeosortase/exosortase family protein, partial [Burkholderiaceae bacterium]|nr:archaeosortase/exosortase family protein [Burkholderiaceae bacterium]
PARDAAPGAAPRWRSFAARAAVHPLPLLALLLAALWPHLVWIARRFGDGSDEPWGVLAIVTVLALVWRDRARLAVPSPRALAVAAALAVTAGLALNVLPMLLAAGIAMLALAVLLTALLPPRPAAALTTLLLLSLPVIASLNFYLGYPLRVATAQAAAPLLALLGIDAQPAAAALLFRGRTVLVDAPCAGIGMLWVGSYTAALLSYLNGADARRTLLHAVAAAVLVFSANVLRNVALFFPEAGLIALPAAAHDAIGLAAFALALGPVVWLTQWRLAARPPALLHTSPHASTQAAAAPSCTTPAATADDRPLRRARATFVGACLAAAAVPLAALALPDRADPAARPAAGEPIEWPTAFRGQPLTQLALTPLEARFAARFPGVIARYAAGPDVLVLRHVTQPTRQLHPAVDCFRAAGFAVDAPRAMVDDAGQAWRCFVAIAPDGQRLRVCERIASVRGDGAWTDVSAWFWAAWRGGGPWWATTVITPLPLHAG